MPHPVTSPDILLVKILSCEHPIYREAGKCRGFFGQVLSPLAKLGRQTASSAAVRIKSQQKCKGKGPEPMCRDCFQTEETL